MTNSATERFGANRAPGDLKIVQELANTRNVGKESDLLGSLDIARTWLAAAFSPSVGNFEPADLDRLRVLRDAVRATLDGEVDDEVGDVRVDLRVQFTSAGVAPCASSDPVDAIGAEVVVALIEARARGELVRLKLCANPDCRVAFFDESRNGSGRWHSSMTCGNAARVRAHRERSPAAQDSKPTT